MKTNIKVSLYNSFVILIVSLQEIKIFVGFGKLGTEKNISH